MEDVKYVTLGEFDFIIVNELDFNNNHYMLALDEKGENTVMLLKSIIEDGKEKAITVDDNAEFELVIQKFKEENN